MCALVQVNLNILLDFKEKSFCYFYYFLGEKKAQERFLQKYFQTIHPELLPEILIFFLNNQIGSWKHHFLAKLDTNESSLWNFHRKTKLSRVVQ